MNKLEQYLNLASRAYYSGSPIINDDQFDRLAESIGYNAVGAKQHGNVERHVYQMYSLQKYYEDEDQKRPLEGISDIVTTAKLDGAAISLLYVDGTLVRALTRGDGTEGQLITELKEYIDATYGEHYSMNKFQATEFIIDNCHGVGFTAGNVMKYVQRYGKKAGRNRQDILKVLHYSMMLLYVHDIETKELNNANQ